jgi:hypothetical protein
MAEKAQKTKFQKLKAAATNYCKTGSAAAKTRLTNAAKTYKVDAIKKGKTATEAEAIIGRTVKCPAVGRTTVKRKTRKKA